MDAWWIRVRAETDPQSTPPHLPCCCDEVTPLAAAAAAAPGRVARVYTSKRLHHTIVKR